MARPNPSETTDRGAASGFRGRVHIDFARCRGIGDCVDACPTAALSLDDDPAGAAARVTLDLGHCIFCGLCEDACNEGAVRMTGEFALAVRHRDDLITTAFYGGTARGPSERKPAAAGGDALRGVILAVFGRSLQVRHIDAGSCNGCEAELESAASPVFDLSRFGVSFVASPAHADVLLVTGTVTPAMRPVVTAAWDAMPEPRQAIAMGACAIGGGVFAGAYEGQACGLEGVIPIDVWVPGCPPAPAAIVHAFTVALDRRRQVVRSETWRGAYPETGMRHQP